MSRATGSRLGVERAQGLRRPGISHALDDLVHALLTVMTAR